MRNISFLFTFSLLVWGSVFSQNPSITIYAPDSVPLNQAFEMDVVIHFADDSTYKAPDLSDFYVMQRQYHTALTSSQLNGKNVVSFGYYYELKPKRNGTCKIGAAGAKFNNEIKNSNAYAILVKPASPDTVALLHNENSPHPMDDPFFHPNLPGSDSLEAALKTLVTKNVLIKVVLSQDTVHLGEKVTATYMIYSYNVGFAGVNILQRPMQSGFISEPDQLDPKRQSTTVYIDGKAYAATEILKYTLTPTHKGKLKAGSLKLSANLQIYYKRSGSRIFDIGRIYTVPMTLESDPIIITVL